MFKKSLLFLALMLFLPVYAAEPVDNGGHAGTPPGFYEDIDPNTLDEDDKPEIPENNDAYQQYSEEEIIIPPQGEKAKPTKNYAEIYNSLDVPNFSYLHNIDPEQVERYIPGCCCKSTGIWRQKKSYA